MTSLGVYTNKIATKFSVLRVTKFAIFGSLLNLGIVSC